MMYAEVITPIVKPNFKSKILKSSLCDSADTYIVVKKRKTNARGETDKVL